LASTPFHNIISIPGLEWALIVSPLSFNFFLNTSTASLPKQDIAKLM